MKTITLRVSDAEHKILAEYAELTERTQNDILREFVRSLDADARSNLPSPDALEETLITLGHTSWYLCAIGKADGKEFYELYINNEFWNKGTKDQLLRSLAKAEPQRAKAELVPGSGSDCFEEA